MPSPDFLCYLVSLLFQLAAVLFALRMTRVATYRSPWVVMAVAFSFMSLFRIVGLLTSTTPPLATVSPTNFAHFAATSSLAISILLFLSLFAIRRLAARHEQSDAARRDVDHRLQVALDAADMGIWELDIPTGAVHWSPTVHRIFGLPTPITQTTNDDFAKLVHPEDLPRVQAAVQASIANRTTYEIEFRSIRPDGATAWIYGRGQPVYDPAGKPLRLIGAVQDLTARKQQELLLSENRQRLDAALSASRTGTFRWDIRTSALDWDENLDRLFGLPPGKTARSLDQFISLAHPDDRQGIIDRCKRCLSEGADFDMEFRVVWPDGSVHWLYDVGKTFPDPADGKPLYMTGACVDITHRKQTETDLRQSEDRFRQLADATPQIVWVASPGDGAVEYFNSRWHSYTGIPIDQALGQGWAAVVHPDDLVNLSKKWTLSLATGQPIENEHRLRRRDGQYRWQLVRGIPITDDTGRPVKWVGTCTDIHDQKSLQEQLRHAREEAERANRTKDDFLAALSHELRTPLAPVLLTTQLLEHDSSLPAHVRADLSDIRRSIEIETRLIDDLLDLTRVSRGKIHLQLAPTDVHDVLRHSIETCRDDTFTDKRLNLVTRFEATHPHTSADPARLGQIFWNLLKNATKFTPAQGTITVTTYNTPPTPSSLAPSPSPLAPSLTIEIADTGVGIPPSTLPHIFDAFEQGGAHVTRQFGGLGLGLSISRALTHLHHGTISASSPGPNQGATFTVTLPTIPTPVLDAPSSELGTRNSELGTPSRSPQSEVHSSKCQSILLVEDHEPTGRVMSRLLSGFGYNVRWENSMHAALAAASSQKFDLVVSDLGLPDGSGHDLMSELKSRYNLRGVALSGYGMEHDLSRSSQSGFVHHLTKPVTIEKLDAIIRDLCT